MTTRRVLYTPCPTRHFTDVFDFHSDESHLMWPSQLLHPAVAVTCDTQHYHVQQPNLGDIATILAGRHNHMSSALDFATRTTPMSLSRTPMSRIPCVLVVPDLTLYVYLYLYLCTVIANPVPAQLQRCRIPRPPAFADRAGLVLPPRSPAVTTTRQVLSELCPHHRCR